LRLGKARFEIREPPRDVAVAPLALDEPQRASPLDHDEVDLATVDVAEVSELEVAACRVFLSSNATRSVAGSSRLKMRSRSAGTSQLK
jgi:hypothetical protein